MGTQIPMQWELIGASSGNEFGNRNHDAGMGMANFFVPENSLFTDN